ncbi:MAG: DUF11 domain-containing protein [Leeuwenhoekiella sp.]
MNKFLNNLVVMGFHKYSLLLLLVSLSVSSQSDCTQSAPPLGIYYTTTMTIPAGEVVCFSTLGFQDNFTIGTIIFEENSKIYVDEGFRLIINAVSSTANDDINIVVDGTLQFRSSPPDFLANTAITIGENGMVSSGDGLNNMKFSGNETNTIKNYGQLNVAVLTFAGSSSANTIENEGLLNIAKNLNLENTFTQIKNTGDLYINESFNGNSKSSYVNCGYMETGTSFNLQGGLIINTGKFKSDGGAIDFSDSKARFENYGEVNVGSINLGGNDSTIYNQGVFNLTSKFQNSGNLLGPTEAGFLGYFSVGEAGAVNSGTVGPNLNFINTSKSGISKKEDIFGTNAGSLTYLSGVVYSCTQNGKCAAQPVSTGVSCPFLDGSFASCYINDVNLSNIECSNNGTTGTSSDDTFYFSLNPTGSNLSDTYSISGDVVRNNIPYGKRATFGPYPIIDHTMYINVTDASGFCVMENIAINPPGTCSYPESTVDTDGDGIFNDVDIDIDGDGIPNDKELEDCDTTANVFSEDFGSGTGYGPALPAGITTYNYRSSLNINDGDYAIANTPYDGKRDWQDLNDHTPEDTNGYMMVVNASYAPGEFYRATIEVEPNTYYKFSAWMVVVNSQETVDNVCGPSMILADVKFQVEDQSGVLGTTSTGEIPFSDPANWEQYVFTFRTAPSDTSIDIVLINNAPGGCGNDLAIDDIKLVPLCDSDGDGVLNHYDLDSDNDGIYDLIEAGGVDSDNNGLADGNSDLNDNGLSDMYDPYCIGSATITGYATALYSSSDVANPSRAIGAPNDLSAQLNNANDYVVLQMDGVIPSGTNIIVRHNGFGSQDNNSIRIEQSMSGSDFKNAVSFTNNNSFQNSTYKLSTNAKFIKISKNGSSNSDPGIDAISYSYSDPCSGIVGVALPVPDTDGDGVYDYLDLDSDDDGCSDANEAYQNGSADGNVGGDDDMRYGTSPVFQNPDGSVSDASYPGTLSAVTDNTSYATCLSDLELVKTVDNAKPTVGDIIFFTIIIKNVGPSATGQIQAKDNLPEGLSYNAINSRVPRGTTYDSTTGIWDLNSVVLQKGDISTLKIAVNVEPGCGEIVNFAEIIRSSKVDPDSTPNNGK